MSDNNIETINTENKEAENAAAETKKTIDPEKGTLTLAVPIRSQSKDLDKIDYDFGKIKTGDYIAAMDSDREAVNPFRISHKQAFHLFAYAVAAVTDGLDARDVVERMSTMDAVYAAQLGAVFFAQQTRAAANRAANV